MVQVPRKPTVWPGSPPRLERCFGDWFHHVLADCPMDSSHSGIREFQGWQVYRVDRIDNVRCFWVVEDIPFEFLNAVLVVASVFSYLYHEFRSNFWSWLWKRRSIPMVTKRYMPHSPYHRSCVICRLSFNLWYCLGFQNWNLQQSQSISYEFKEHTFWATCNKHTCHVYNSWIYTMYVYHNVIMYI